MNDVKRVFNDYSKTIEYGIAAHAEGLFNGYYATASGQQSHDADILFGGQRSDVNEKLETEADKS